MLELEVVVAKHRVGSTDIRLCVFAATVMRRRCSPPYRAVVRRVSSTRITEEDSRSAPVTVNVTVCAKTAKAVRA